MKKKYIVVGIIFACIVAALIVGICLTGSLYTDDETISETMRDAVLHENDKVDLFGLEVNPGLISGFIVTAVLLVAAAIIRIFVIPRFKTKPGKFQLFIESVVGYFSGEAQRNSPHMNSFLGAYIFAVGLYIFFGTLFELFGFQVVTVNGTSVALPAPLSDINGAIAIGCLSYLVILSGGICSNGMRGVGRTLKEFSLPLSMSFRLFGALLSGLLVTELVYYYLSLSFVIPVIVGVLFTILHAIIQTYVLVTLTALFYGEVSEPYVKKKREHHSSRVKNKTVNQEV